MPTNFTPEAVAKPVWPTVLTAVILTALVTSGGTYWLVKRSFETSLPVAETTMSGPIPLATVPTTATPTTTAEANKYSSTDYKFAFSYDPDWTAKETASPTDKAGILLSVVLNPKGAAVANSDKPSAAEVLVYKKLSDLNRVDHPDGTLDAKIKTVKQYLDAGAALADPTYTDVKEVTIGNTKGWRAKRGPNQVGGGVEYFIDQDNDGLNIIAIWVLDETDEHGNIILSSFELTK